MRIEKVCARCGEPIYLVTCVKKPYILTVLKEGKESVCNVCEPKSAWKRKDRDNVERVSK